MLFLDREPLPSGSIMGVMGILADVMATCPRPGLVAVSSLAWAIAMVIMINVMLDQQQRRVRQNPLRAGWHYGAGV
ncbi:MAG: hypothetical protein ACLRXB_01305 [Escherichia coli]